MDAGKGVGEVMGLFSWTSPPLVRHLDDTIEATLRLGRPRQCDEDEDGVVAENANAWDLFSESY